VKHHVNSGLRFEAFHMAQRTIQGYEAMYLLHKDQLEGMAKSDALAQNRGINPLFG
jgi:hypothetical protein